MKTLKTLEDINAAAAALGELDRGKQVLAVILTLKDAGFRGLDEPYQSIAISLILAMSNQGGFAGSVPEAITAQLHFNPAMDSRAALSGGSKGGRR